MEKNKKFKKDSCEKALVFSHCIEFIIRFADSVYNSFRFPVSSLQSIDSLINALYATRYSVIFLDVNSIFCELNEILNHIADKRSRNKRTKLYLITSSKEIAPKLAEIRLHKKIFTLFDGEEIVYLIGGKKMSLLENSLNSSSEEYNNAC
jgi:hypothetical protein